MGSRTGDGRSGSPTDSRPPLRSARPAQQPAMREAEGPPLPGRGPVGGLSSTAATSPRPNRTRPARTRVRVPCFAARPVCWKCINSIQRREMIPKARRPIRSSLKAPGPGSTKHRMSSTQRCRQRRGHGSNDLSNPGSRCQPAPPITRGILLFKRPSLATVWTIV